jgi:hypothetical protein
MKLMVDLKGFLRLHDLVPSGNGKVKKGRMIAEVSDAGSFDMGSLLREGPNIITTLGRMRVAELLAGIPGAMPVTAMALGDGGAPQTDLLTPIVPTLADTALAHELTRTTTINPVVTGQVLTFSAPFLTASLVPIDFINPLNQVVNEAGLFTGDNVLFARKTFPSIPFAPGDRLGVLGDWIITVL